MKLKLSQFLTPGHKFSILQKESKYQTHAYSKYNLLGLMPEYVSLKNWLDKLISHNDKIRQYQSHICSSVNHAALEQRSFHSRNRLAEQTRGTRTLKNFTTCLPPSLSRILHHGSSITDPPSRILHHGSSITDPTSRILHHGSSITDPPSPILHHGSSITDNPLTNIS